MSEHEGEAALLDAARAGDRGALEQLIERYQARLYRFGLEMCRDREDARDVVQNTLMAMARGVRDFRGESSLSTWLYSVARSYCIKARRRSKFAPAEVRSIDDSPEATALADPGRAPDDELAGRRVEQALARAIGELDPKYREVLVLRDVEGLTAPEVAEVLGIRVDAVKSRLHRARLAVRERVAPALGVPPDSAEARKRRGCPDVLGVFERHLEGDLAPDDCARMEQHLAGCETCRGACSALRQQLSLCRSTPAQVPDSVRHSVQRAIRDLLEKGA